MHNDFFDIHCHILPGLDEGSPSPEHSIKMIQMAHADGIAGIVATPHIVAGVYNNTRETIGLAVRELKALVNHVELYIGAEIRIDRDLAARASNNQIPMINDRRYILLELPAYLIPPVHELENIVRTLTAAHIIPIFAHPERNIPIIRDLTIIKRLIGCGALFQATAMSLSDPAIQKLALKMISKGYIHAVASDAHDDRKRPPVLSAAYEIVAKKMDRDIADRLFRDNPHRIIRGEDIEGSGPR